MILYLIYILKSKTYHTPVYTVYYTPYTIHCIHSINNRIALLFEWRPILLLFVFNFLFQLFFAFLMINIHHQLAERKKMYLSCSLSFLIFRKVFAKQYFQLTYRPTSAHAYIYANVILLSISFY